MTASRLPWQPGFLAGARINGGAGPRCMATQRGPCREGEAACIAREGYAKPCLSPSLLTGRAGGRIWWQVGPSGLSLLLLSTTRAGLPAPHHPRGTPERWCPPESRQRCGSSGTDPPTPTNHWPGAAPGGLPAQRPTLPWAGTSTLRATECPLAGSLGGFAVANS